MENNIQENSNKKKQTVALIISTVIVVVFVIGAFVLIQKNSEEKSLSNKNSANNREIEIKDTCEPGLAYPDAIEEYYEDEKYICSFNQIRSGCYTVTVDGKEYPLKDALNNKVITVEEAMEHGLYCSKKSTGIEESNSNTNTNITSNSNSTSNVETNSNSNESNTNTNSTINSSINTNTNTHVISNSNLISSSNIISSSNVVGNKTIKVYNRCGDNQTSQIDEFYQDNEYIYYFTSGMSGCTYVSVNGTEYGLKTALNDKIVTMKELESVGFKCLKKSRNLVEK